MNIAKLLPGVKRNILLKKDTTFRIGGPAKYFFAAKTKKDLVKAILMAKKYKLPFFILGGGSNVLAADKGYEGLVIKTQNSKLKVQNHNLKLKTIYVESGVRLSHLLKISLEKSLMGLEWAAGIPGSVGGAIRGNAGSFGKSMKDVVETVEVFDAETEKIKFFKNKDCKFSYRESIFKKKPNLIILSLMIQLKKEGREEIKNKIKKNLEQRKKTQPLNFPSAGSIFKNTKYQIPNEKLQSKIKKDKNIKTIIKNNIIPAGYLIEKCGLKGKKINKAQISEKHSNFIVNLGGAKAKDVKELIKLIKEKVKKKFGIILETEIELL
ncbi:MAG: UDP-N-acetylmuramate dehydrogenase [Candidatus Nealsonbacteria bacterium]|nr:UDP-N-acetylmuramate dehydrogenase [Candidatus Nealsonbacteria bacterium]